MTFLGHRVMTAVRSKLRCYVWWTKM